MDGANSSSTRADAPLGSDEPDNFTTFVSSYFCRHASPSENPARERWQRICGDGDQIDFKGPALVQTTRFGKDRTRNLDIHPYYQQAPLIAFVLENYMANRKWMTAGTWFDMPPSLFQKPVPIVWLLALRPVFGERLRDAREEVLCPHSDRRSGGLFEGVATNAPFEGKKNRISVGCCSYILERTRGERSESPGPSDLQRVHRRTRCAFKSGAERVECDNRNRGTRCELSRELRSGNQKHAIWDPGFFSKILAPSALKDKSLRSIANPDGFGGTLVGVHKPDEPRKWLLPLTGRFSTRYGHR